MGHGNKNHSSLNKQKDCSMRMNMKNCPHANKDSCKMHADSNCHMMNKNNMTGKQMNNMQSETGNATCPVMNNPVNRDLYVDHNGKRIYVCCAMCVNEVKKNPDKYLKKLEKMGEKPGKVPAK